MKLPAQRPEAEPTTLSVGAMGNVYKGLEPPLSHISFTQRPKAELRTGPNNAPDHSLPLLDKVQETSNGKIYGELFCLYAV